MPMFWKAKNIDASHGNFTDVAGNQIIYNNQPQIPVQDLRSLLKPVDGAAYNHITQPAKCMEGTREKLLTKIMNWRSWSSSLPLVCWLKGPAGSGKSAIAWTIAERCDVKDQLAASFFFRQGTGDRSVIHHLVLTLAYQLAHSVPATKPLIEKVLLSDPTIDQKSLDYQFKELMIKPMLAVTNTSLVFLKARKRFVIVVDALDECDDKDLTAQFIDMVINACHGGGRFPFRIFFTSRVEEHIRDKFESPHAQKAIHCLDLLDFDAHIDIRTFFQARFIHIHTTNRFMRGVPEPWPSDKDLDALIEKANGSFIFASTLIKFFEEDDEFPPTLLQRVLKVDVGLDLLYTQVLSAAPCNDNFDRLVGTVILLTRPLSVTALGHLLQLENHIVLQVLLGIQSIVLIPEDDDEPIQLFHTSFRDFMTAKSRSDNYFVDPPACNISIATDCLKVMNAGSEDLIFEGEAQKYACLNWFLHLGDVLTQGGAFKGQSFNCWINTLIFVGKKETVKDMRQLVSKFQHLATGPQNIIQLVESFTTSAEV